MKSLSKSMRHLIKAIAITPLITFSGLVFSANLAPLVDDFNSETQNSLGIDRMFMTDQMSGGGTTNDVQIVNGIMQIKGDLLPPRGQPAWSSSVLLLGPENTAQDASKYRGVRMLVKLNKGMLSLSANSTKVTNFDYHAAPVMVPSDGQFHQVDIPFTTMKPSWSEPTELDPSTLASLSIVAFSVQPSSYEFEVDQVSFY